MLPCLGAAFESLTTTCDHEPQWCYWINSTEIHMLAGSCALDLGDPRRALDHFTTAHTAFDTGDFPGGAAIYLARAAEAHLALGERDAAAGLGTQALRCHTTIDSARGDQTLTSLRTKLARQGRIPAVGNSSNTLPHPEPAHNAPTGDATAPITPPTAQGKRKPQRLASPF